ncbi:MAG: STAS domain-containing protein, partial [Desulfobacterales bacterium]
MDINISEKQDTFIMSVRGRLDAITAPELEKTISKYADSDKSKIILDFNELEYISSAGLRVVLVTAKMMKTKQGELRVSGLKGTVKDVFELSGFYTI